MSQPFEALGRIRMLAAELEPHQFRARMRDWQRGGLPSSSMPDGSRTAEAPLPLPDRFDRMLKERWFGYRADILKAAALLERALRTQNWLLQPAERPPDMPAPVPCMNVACDRFLEEGRKSGECSRCRNHRRNHGEQWPKTSRPPAA